MSVAAGERRQGDVAGKALAPRLYVPTWAEALPLLGFKPRVTGIGRQSYDLTGCTAVLLAGFAGACAPHLEPGNVVLSGEVPPEMRALQAELRTLDHIATPSEKATLYAAGVAAVDMETRWLAEAAAAAGLPFLGVRAIIDRQCDHAVGVASMWHFGAACRGLRRAVGNVLRVWPRLEVTS